MQTNIKNQMSREITQSEYNTLFSNKKRESALQHALDIRKFEIELYWKRATYFWTFIGVALAGYGAVFAASVDLKTDLLVILSCLGFVFSFAWFCVNRGSSIGKKIGRITSICSRMKLLDLYTKQY